MFCVGFAQPQPSQAPALVIKRWRTPGYKISRTSDLGAGQLFLSFSDWVALQFLCGSWNLSVWGGLGFPVFGWWCCPWVATGNMCLKDTGRARAGRSQPLLCVSARDSAVCQLVDTAVQGVISPALPMVSGSKVAKGHSSDLNQPSSPWHWSSGCHGVQAEQGRVWL